MITGEKNMKIIQENPMVCDWSNGIWIVKISEVGDEFFKWLHGQTLPLVEEDENPTGWAYYCDYSRFMNGLPIVD